MNMSNRMSHLIPLSVLSEELKLNTTDTLTLIKIYNSNTIKDNRFNDELLNNEYFIKKNTINKKIYNVCTKRICM